MRHVYTAGEDDKGLRADVFLARVSNLSRSRIKKLIDNGQAMIARCPLKASHIIESGERIELDIHPPEEESGFAPEDIPLEIVYSDRYLAVINKPPGMVVHPGRGNITGTMVSALLHHFGELSTTGGKFRPGIVHRLDKNTSGLIITALNDDIHNKLSNMLQSRKIKREYTAFVWGHPKPESGIIDASVGRNPSSPTLRAVVKDGRPSVTNYLTEASYEFLSKLKVNLETGRTHQIRVHFAHIGHHIFGDPEYGGRETRLKGFDPSIRGKARALLKILDRQALHASRLVFVHPVTGEKMEVESSLPPDLCLLEQKLLSF